MKWIPHLTQMGGFAIGANEVLGAPEFISSVPGFEDKDKYLIKYYDKIEYRKIEKNDFSFKEKINLIVTNPPCAGLSRLTSNTCSQEHKCNLNDLMINTIKQCIFCYDTDVIIGESAEGLFGKSGEPVLNDLNKLASNNGYAVTLYKTDTKYHGLPQSRVRTFYILWKSKFSFKLGKISNEYLPLKDFLKSSKDSKVINKDLLKDFTYVYIKDKLKLDPREAVKTLKSVQHNTFQYILENNLFDDIADFYKDDENTYKKILTLKKKKSEGNNVILNYPRFWYDIINGITWKNMGRSVHPTEDRSLTVREAMQLMGFPDDYPEIELGEVNIIGKNVPVLTGKTIIEKCIGYFDNTLEKTDVKFFKEDNIKYNENFYDLDEW